VSVWSIGDNRGHTDITFGKRLKSDEG
jgi:hypothetical protein